MAFDKVFQGDPSTQDVAAPGTHQSPAFGIDVPNRILYISAGSGWQSIASSGGSGGFTTLPDAALIAPNGGTTYSLGTTPTAPAASFYFVNGIKRTYGLYYTISGSTLTLLTSDLPNASDGDTHEIYVT